MQAVRDDSDEELSSSDEEEDAPPVLHSRALTYSGGVNRLRAMPQRPGVLAAWADTGAVQARLSQYLCRQGQGMKTLFIDRTAACGRHMPQRPSVLAACARRHKTDTPSSNGTEWEMRTFFQVLARRRSWLTWRQRQTGGARGKALRPTM